MSKTWYPILNYEECINCEACINKCSHGVYEMKNSRSVVVKPEGCIQGCHGCGSLCPVGAIEYVGENTDWTPPGKQEKTEENGSCCSSDSNKDSRYCGGSSCCN